MAQKWYQGVMVQAAIIGAIGVIAAALITSWFTVQSIPHNGNNGGPDIVVVDSSSGPGTSGTQDSIFVSIETISRLVQGRIAYQVPDTMTIDVDTTLWVRVSKAQSDSILIEEAGLQNNYDIHIDKIQVSSSVAVRVVDPSLQADRSFHITALSPERQSVDKDASSLWEWQIRPLKAGSLPLHITAEVHIINDFGQLPKYVPVYNNKVVVEAIPGKGILLFLEKYWQWLIVIIVIPMIRFGYGRLVGFRNTRRTERARREKEEEDRKKVAGMS